jgi:hypothetical protein
MGLKQAYQVTKNFHSSVKSSDLKLTYTRMVVKNLEDFLDFKHKLLVERE